MTRLTSFRRASGSELLFLTLNNIISSITVDAEHKNAAKDRPRAAHIHIIYIYMATSICES